MKRLCLTSTIKTLKTFNLYMHFEHSLMFLKETIYQYCSKGVSFLSLSLNIRCLKADMGVFLCSQLSLWFQVCVQLFSTKNVQSPRVSFQTSKFLLSVLNVIAIHVLLFNSYCNLKTKLKPNYNCSKDKCRLCRECDVFVRCWTQCVMVTHKYVQSFL